MCPFSWTFFLNLGFRPIPRRRASRALGAGARRHAFWNSRRDILLYETRENFHHLKGHSERASISIKCGPFSFFKTRFPISIVFEKGSHQRLSFDTAKIFDKGKSRHCTYRENVDLERDTSSRTWKALSLSLSLFPTHKTNRDERESLRV